jgi:hypothetical protein
MRYLFWLSVLVSCLSVNLHAQQTQSVRCPVFGIKGPLSDLRPPQIYTIESTEELTTPELTFKWEASAGTILSGQGTKVITFDPGNTQNSTITLTIGGLPPACQNMVSISSIVCLGPPDARKFDELTLTDGVSYKAQLDAFAKALRNDPSAYAVVLVYSGGKQQANELSKRAADAIEYLVKECGLDQKRIEIIQRETRDKEAIEFWLGQAGSAIPDPDPPRLKP